MTREGLQGDAGSNPAEAPPNTPIRLDLFQRDLNAIRRHARELLRQCDHYERNGEGDELRFGFMYLEARNATYYARRADRRYAKQSGMRALA